MEVDKRTKKAFSRGYLFGLLKPDKLFELTELMTGSSPYCKAFQEGVAAGKARALEKRQFKGKGRGFDGKIEL